MSKLWTNQFGERRKSTPRGLRLGHGIFTLCLMLGLLVSAASAWAAEVVEVRVGRHPEFTRLVFELDRAAGYRVQRTDAGSDSELVISLEANSIPRSLRSSNTLIEQVDVTPNGSRSVARIRLTEEGFRLKEMILSNPPRIVLDLVSEKTVARATSNKPKISSTASRIAANAKAKKAKEAEAQAKAQAKAQAEAKAKAQATAAAAVKAKAQAAANAAKETQRKLAAESQKLADAAKDSAASAKSSTSAAADRAMVTAKTTIQGTADSAAQASKAATKAAANTVADAAEKSKEMASNAAAAASGIVDRNSAASKTPTPNANANANAKAKPKTPRPMVAKKTTDDEGGWLTWALVAAGALVVGGAGLLFARRRGDAEEVDFSEDGDDKIDFGGDEATVMTGDEDENPFASLAGGTADADATTVAPATQTPFAEDDGMDGEATKIVPLPDDEKESETVVFERVQENDMDDMEVISRDQVNESLGGAMPPVGGVPEEFQQMMRDMNARMQALEGRCEELVDARDRLERQVAAQTEELRVQRAAIARTQRAVRNLARPEDAGEDEATEPALRDPNQ